MTTPGLAWAAGILVLIEVLMHAFPAIGVVFGANMDFHRYYYEAEAVAAAPDVEFLILGDSSIQNGVHPGVVSKAWNVPRKSVFNLSYGAGSPGTFAPFLRDNLDRMVNLRNVVWIMNDSRFSVECNYRPHRSMHLGYILHNYSWRQILTTDLIPLYLSRLYRMALLWTRENVRRLFQIRWIDGDQRFFFPSGGGWMLLHGGSKAGSKPTKNLEIFRKVKPCPFNIRAFMEIAERLKERGIGFYVLRHAVAPSLRRYMPREFPRMFEITRKVLENIPAEFGVSVDLEGLHGFHPSLPTYYLDSRHLVYFGAVEYSRFIARHLRAAYGFPGEGP